MFLPCSYERFFFLVGFCCSADGIGIISSYQTVEADRSIYVGSLSALYDFADTVTDHTVVETGHKVVLDILIGVVAFSVKRFVSKHANHLNVGRCGFLVCGQAEEGFIMRGDLEERTGFGILYGRYG